MPEDRLGVKFPGKSRLRQVEQILRDHRVVVLPDDWDAFKLAEYMQQVLQNGTITLIQQYRLEQTYADAYPDPHTRVLLPGPKVRILLWSPNP